MKKFTHSKDLISITTLYVVKIIVIFIFNLLLHNLEYAIMSVHILSPCLEDPCVDMKSGNQQLGPLVLLSLREKLLSGTAVKLDEESIPG